MADVIQDFPQVLHTRTQMFCRQVPSQVATHQFVDQLINLFFPMRDKRGITQTEMAERWSDLQRDFLAIIQPLCLEVIVEQCPCAELTRRFFERMPALYDSLLADAQMYKDSDPAAHCVEEVIVCYPGFYAIMVHRIAHEIHQLGIPILPRVVAEYAHSRTGIDIHPGAQIGAHFYIDHGTGVVIGETTVIGRRVKIYQGVTLGATFVDKELSGQRRHPTIEDDVIIYAGSTILGGETVIGHDTIVGGNVWLTESVSPNSVVYHKPEVLIRDKSPRA